MTTSKSTPCPCGSEQDLSKCCLPVIEGKKKPTVAEELLRARYTAFTRGNVDFILDSHHSKTRAEVKREEIEEWSKNSQWLGLKVVQSEGGKAEDDKGTIVFCATYNDEAGKKQDHWEQALFEKESGQWKFLDARGIRTGPYVRQEPKVGRNDPCGCGSGKKAKKCCGAA
jgi:SEC-C motif-containing protein